MDFYSENAAELAAKAKEKLEAEYKDASYGKRELVMKDAVKAALISFIEQDAEFAKAVTDNSQTFGDCMKEVAKGVGNSISDFEAFGRAAAFYFPGAKIEFKMVIHVNPFDGEVQDTGDDMTLSIMDIL